MKMLQPGQLTIPVGLSLVRFIIFSREGSFGTFIPPLPDLSIVLQFLSSSYRSVLPVDQFLVGPTNVLQTSDSIGQCH